MSSPPSISTILVTMRFMNSRSCEVMTSAPSNSFKKPSSQMIDSRSRWLVGSSSSSASGRISRMRASATRIFQPPESAPTSPSITSCAKAEAGQDLARLGFERVAAELFEARLRVAEVARSAAPARRARAGSASACSSSCSSAATVDTGPAPSIVSATTLLPAHLADVLAEVADGHAAIDRHLAAVGRFFARDHDGKMVVLPEPLGPTRPTFSPRSSGGSLEERESAGRAAC